MKTKFLFLVIILLSFCIKISAQASYMHEAAEDAGYNNDVLDFLGALQWVIILGIGILLLIGFGIGWIKEFFEDSPSTIHTPQISPNEIVSQGEFYNGWSRFKTHSGKYGYIDTNGNILKCISPYDARLNRIQYFSEAEEFIHDVVIVKLDTRQYALINKLGCNINRRNEKPRNETYIKELENGLIYYYRRDHLHHDVFNHEYYVYNRKGEMVYDGILEDVKVNKDGNLEIKNNEGSAIVTPQGKFIIPFCKKSVQLNNSLYKVFSSEGLCGVYDNSKQRMILQYQDYGNLLYIEEQNLFLCSQYRSTGKERNWNIVDSNENILFTLYAESVKVLNEKYLLASHKNSYLLGLYSFDGKNIVPHLYDEILCSNSATEFLAMKRNPDDYFDINSYTLYDTNGEITTLDSYNEVSYHTIKKSTGTIRTIGPYSSDKEVIRKVDCPAFTTLTKQSDNNIRSSIINMKNKIIIPNDYLCFEEITDSNMVLSGFKAHFPTGVEYHEFDLEGNIIKRGNYIEDKQIEEELEFMFPDYKRMKDREDEAVWLSLHEMDDFEYNDYDDLY